MGMLAALRATAVALALVVSAVGLSGLWHAAAVPDTQATVAALPDVQAIVPGLPDEVPAGPDVAELVTAIAGAPQVADPRDPPGAVRLPKPTTLPLDGPRKVAIQAGHWMTREAPPELGRILQQTGTSWGGITEVDVNVGIAQRVAALLAEQGVQAEVLPTTIPPGYLADAFVALHADGDGVGERSGFKAAHSTRRTPFENRFMELMTDEYARATELDYDKNGITRQMTGYYAMAWSRIRYTTSPFTPSVILEMGYLSNEWDRQLMVDQPDLVAGAIAAGILRFLDEAPRSALFGQDLVLPPAPRRQLRSPLQSPPAG